MTVTMTTSDTIGIATETDSKTTCQCSVSNVATHAGLGVRKDPTVPEGAAGPSRSLRACPFASPLPTFEA
jgi:hypothetical protein